MAAALLEDNCIYFVRINFDNTLYFVTENDKNLRTDYFGKLDPKFSILWNLNNQVLFIYEENQAVFKNMADSDCIDNASQTKFIICRYKDSLTRGLAVAICVKCNKVFTLL